MKTADTNKQLSKHCLKHYFKSNISIYFFRFYINRKNCHIFLDLLLLEKKSWTVFGRMPNTI